MISDEPPPTSTTAISPSTGCPSAFVAPMKAKRPSSSSLRTSTSTPASRSISATTLSRFLASRIAAVATVLIASAPSSSASRRWVATASAISATFSAVILPLRRDALSMRVYARCSITVRSWPPSGSATSSRVVFEPMSIAAQSIRYAASHVVRTEGHAGPATIVTGSLTELTHRGSDPG